MKNLTHKILQTNDQYRLDMDYFEVSTQLLDQYPEWLMWQKQANEIPMRAIENFLDPLLSRVILDFYKIGEK